MRAIFALALLAVAFSLPIHDNVLCLIEQEDVTAVVDILHKGGADVHYALDDLVLTYTSRVHAIILGQLFPDSVFIFEGVSPLDVVVLELNSQFSKSAIANFADILHSSQNRVIVSSSHKTQKVDWESLPGVESITVSPIPFAKNAGVVDNKRSARFQSLRRHLAHRDDISDLIAHVNVVDLREFAEYLTGEDSDQFTRLSTADDTNNIVDWVDARYSGYGFNSSLHDFLPNYCANVIAEKRGTIYPNSVVVIGAHLDDRAQDISDPTMRAPGANDDGSGSAAMLQIAKIISEGNVNFAYTVRIASWCGEEQGLLGSRAYAKEVSERGEDIVAMFQADMIAYRQTGLDIGVGFVTRYTDPDLTDLVRDITKMYVPELVPSDTTACCSDHQSFYEQGYASAGLVEPGGYSIDPQYHRTGDLVNRDGYNFDQVMGITRILLASASVIAELQ